MTSQASKLPAVCLGGLLLAIYILLPGPIAWLVETSRFPESPTAERVVNIVIYPLGLAYEHVPTVHRFYDWYLSFWIK